MSTTTTTTTIPPSTVLTQLNYYVTPANGGQTYWYPGTASNFNRPQDVRPVDVTDIRHSEEKPTLDVHGFQLVQHASSQTEFVDEKDLMREYYAETAGLVKRVTGATHVHTVSHLIRRNAWKEAVSRSRDLDDLAPIKGGYSGAYCHVDQSYQGAVELLADNLTPSEASRLGQTRWAIINVWRPVNQTVRREPLAMCDARSVEESDLYPVRLHMLRSGDYKSITGGDSWEAWALAGNDKHRWYYASEMAPDEVVMIKCYDSKLDGRARRCPHSAFSTEKDAGPSRESIEMRCLVFWEDQARD